MKSEMERIRSSSRTAIVALSLGALWCAALLFDGIGKAVTQASAQGGLDALAVNYYVPIRVVVLLATLGALLGVTISLFVTIGRQGTPFVPQVPRRIKLMALLVFLCSELHHWVGYLLALIRDGRAGWAIIENDGIIGLIFAAVLYALATVFQYGCQLQRESDETL